MAAYELKVFFYFYNRSITHLVVRPQNDSVDLVSDMDFEELVIRCIVSLAKPSEDRNYQRMYENGKLDS